MHKAIDASPPPSRGTTPAAVDPPAWWLTPLPALFEELGASENGLTHAEAGARLKRYGLNTFRSSATQSAMAKFLRRFRNP